MAEPDPVQRPGIVAPGVTVASPAAHLQGPSRSSDVRTGPGAVIGTIEGEELVPQVHIGTEAPRLRLADSLSGLCVRTGELQRSDDLETDPRVRHNAYRDLGVRSLLAVPASPFPAVPLPARRAANRTDLESITDSLD